MITNERQYKITKSELKKLQEAIKQFDFEYAVKDSGSEILAKAQLDALQSEVDVLLKEIQEYDILKSGSLKILKANSLRELPKILIQARIVQGLSQLQLADELKLKEQQIQRYESEEYKTASLNRLVEVAEALKLNISEIAELKPKHFIPIISKGIDDINWNRFPIEQMYRRGWFEGFSGSLNAVKEEGENLVKEFITNITHHPITSFHKKHLRYGIEPDQYSLIAWECRIIYLANKSEKTASFNRKFLTRDLLLNLAKQSQFKDGPILAKSLLNEIGIQLIIEPHLPNTYLDGAVLLNMDNPIIGLTLRFDRLDNFWFVLFHELAHIIKHLKKGKLERIFDDLEAEPDELEKEADMFALNSLIPESNWETALPRFLRSESSVISFAQAINISPAIVAGRIRYEAKNYIILNSLIGHGEVRKLFPEVKFSI